MRHGLYLSIFFESWLDIQTGPLNNSKTNILIDHDRDEVSLFFLGHVRVLLILNGDQNRTTMDMRGLSVVVQ